MTPKGYRRLTQGERLRPSDYFRWPLTGEMQQMGTGHAGVRVRSRGATYYAEGRYFRKHK